MNNSGLPQRTINELLRYFNSKPEIEKVILYGSRAKGNYHNGSDVDFAILTDKHNNISSISSELDELDTPYKFDVIDYKTLTHEGLKKSIQNDGIVFFAR